jgi:hypothetical protein
MTDTNIPDVTLASADPALLSCWEEKVKEGTECSLLLKHSKGEIITILTTSVSRSSEARAPVTSKASQAEKTKKKKKNKGNKTKRLESLISFQQKLVRDKGLPATKLMMQHAAAEESSPSPAQTTEQEKNSELFKCDLCEFRNSTKQGVNSHKEHTHKDQQKPEDLTAEQTVKIKCDKCNSEFRDSDQLIYHLKEKHRVFACRDCDHKSSSGNGLRIHIAKMHSLFKETGQAFITNTYSRNLKYTCQICNQSIIQFDDAVKHVNNVHPYFLDHISEQEKSSWIEAEERNKERRRRDKTNNQTS